MKFGQLTVSNFIKIVAARCQILRLKCTQIDFGWGSAPNLSRELTALSRPLCWNEGDLLLRKGEGQGRRGRRKQGEGREKEWKGLPCVSVDFPSISLHSLYTVDVFVNFLYSLVEFCVVTSEDGVRSKERT